MTSGRNTIGTVVIGVIGNDIHVVANRILEMSLQSAGFEVLNLGTNVKPDEFADAALEVGAEAVLIGSLNGEAPHWCHGLKARFAARGLDHVKLYLGGNVVTGELPRDEVEAMFTRVGIDRVFYGTTDFDALTKTLRKDMDGTAAR